MPGRVLASFQITFRSSFSVGIGIASGVARLVRKTIPIRAHTEKSLVAVSTRSIHELLGEFERITANAVILCEASTQSLAKPAYIASAFAE